MRIGNVAHIPSDSLRIINTRICFVYCLNFNNIHNLNSTGWRFKNCNFAKLSNNCKIIIRLKTSFGISDIHNGKHR